MSDAFAQGMVTVALAIISAHSSAPDQTGKRRADGRVSGTYVLFDRLVGLPTTLSKTFGVFIKNVMSRSSEGVS